MNRTITIAVLAIFAILCLVSCKTADVNLGIQVQEYQEQLSGMQAQMDQMQAQIKDLQNQVTGLEQSTLTTQTELTEQPSQAEQTEQTSQLEQVEQNNTEPETEVIEEPAVDPLFWEIGQIGPFGGLVFQHDGKCYEIAQPLYEAGSYENAADYCKSLTPDIAFANEYRLPTVDELLAIYDQLVMTEISDLDWTYYWSCEETDETSAKVVNFDTGFEGKFYKNMDFVSALAVCEL
ncbi:MAG: DUF1566 domain-containing protein [Sphaerochaetaceae bacterium]|nr:DUF1566 domain-containing protein [Sphaerochaetaceae bacterium]